MLEAFLGLGLCLSQPGESEGVDEWEQELRQEEGAVLGCYVPCSAAIGGDGQGLAR